MMIDRKHKKIDENFDGRIWFASWPFHAIIFSNILQLYDRILRQQIFVRRRTTSFIAFLKKL